MYLQRHTPTDSSHQCATSAVYRVQYPQGDARNPDGLQYEGRSTVPSLNLNPRLDAGPRELAINDLFFDFFTSWSLDYRQRRLILTPFFSRHVLWIGQEPMELNAKALLDCIGGSYSLKGQPYTGPRWSMFRTDKIAEQLVPDDARDLCPVSVVGDGNCLLLSQEQLKE